MKGIIRKIREANKVIDDSGRAIDKRGQQDEVAKKREQKKQGKSSFQLDSMGRDVLGIVHAERCES
jgi:hypothetical protein